MEQSQDELHPRTSLLGQRIKMIRHFQIPLHLFIGPTTTHPEKFMLSTSKKKNKMHKSWIQIKSTIKNNLSQVSKILILSSLFLVDQHIILPVTYL